MRLYWVCLTLSIKFIARHRRKSFATGGFIAIGTAILIILNGITSGINETMVKNTTHLHTGHILIDLKGHSEAAKQVHAIHSQLDKRKKIETILHRAQFTALITKDIDSIPSIIYEVDPLAESKTTAISRNIQMGRYLKPDKREILIGSGIAKTLHIKVNETIQLFHKASEGTVSFKVSGIFHTGVHHFDHGISYIPTHQLETSKPKMMKSHLAVFLKDHLDSELKKTEFQQHLPETTQISSWDELMPDLVQLIDMNDASMSIIMVLVFVLVGFGISNTFILTIVDRYNEFGILKAMGITPKELVRIIFFESFIICLIATACGFFAGWLITAITAINGIDFSQFTSHNQYFVLTSIVKPKLDILGILKPVVLSIVVSLISSYLPARLAGKKIAADMLRFS